MVPLAPPRPHLLPRYLDKRDERDSNQPVAGTTNLTTAPGGPDLAPRTDDRVLIQTWQRTLLVLQASVAPEEYQRWVCPIRLVELDTERKAALLGLPSPALRDQVQTRLAPFICMALNHVCGVQLRVFVIALPGSSDGPIPTLARILAEQPPSESVPAAKEGGAT
jgi:hypothetical protein